MTGNNHQTVPLGSVRTIEVYWFNQAGALATPSTTTWAQRKPTQTEADRTAVTTGWTTVSTGRQTRDVTLDEPGLWSCEARGAGNSVDDVQQFFIEVIDTRVGA